MTAGNPWTIDEPVWAEVHRALAATVPGLRDELDTMRSVRRLRLRRRTVA